LLCERAAQKPLVAGLRHAQSYELVSTDRWPTVDRMTLVLNVLTPECVIQVSDRRLVKQTTGAERAVLHDDEANKAVLWRGRLAFAYSGLADLGTEQRTDLWLARTLAEIQEESRTSGEPGVNDQRHLLAQFAERCTAEFRRASIQSLDGDMRTQSFVAVGWAKFNGEPDFSPYLACVSNLYARSDLKPLRDPTREGRACRIARGARAPRECAAPRVSCP
jgi:hypothetical protein